MICTGESPERVVTCPPRPFRYDPTRATPGSEACLVPIDCAHAPVAVLEPAEPRAVRRSAVPCLGGGLVAALSPDQRVHVLRRSDLDVRNALNATLCGRLLVPRSSWSTNARRIREKRGRCACSTCMLLAQRGAAA